MQSSTLLHAQQGRRGERRQRVRQRHRQAAGMHVQPRRHVHFNISLRAGVQAAHRKRRAAAACCLGGGALSPVACRNRAAGLEDRLPERSFDRCYRASSRTL